MQKAKGKTTTQKSKPSKIQTRTEPKPAARELNLERVKQLLDSAENQIQQVRNLIFSGVYGQKAKQLTPTHTAGTKIIEGVFDGESMVAADSKKYPVPPNYASKSKLVAGDVMKLTVGGDGSFIFKQIGPVDRKKLIGRLDEVNGRYQVMANGKRYSVLLASITYFKARPGDELTIIVPKHEQSNFAAVENVVSVKR